MDDCRADAEQSGLVRAVRDNKPDALFDALLTSFSFQGISDSVASGYLQRNGTATWASIKRNLTSEPACHHLGAFNQVRGCRYDKGSFTCAEPELIEVCPLPGYRLRNGRLNQTTFSFYLFVRDVAGGDLITWIDNQLTQTPLTYALSDQQPPGFERQVWLQDQLVMPLRAIFGVSDKILTMALSSLLIGASAIGASIKRPLWFEAGATMIAVDTLVHNFLHRSGIRDQCGRPHAYGALCYAPGGCADIIRKIAAEIDARQFNPAFPKTFPRFVQHGLWQYCAADALNICNGNRIDDRRRCHNSYCQLYRSCGRIQLKS